VNKQKNMESKKLRLVSSELKKASAMHKKQAGILDKMLKKVKKK
tara:strand:- start:814 stop:945 length:132 start_codon:yes stop_codon:yes gene_type:complete